MHVDQTGTNDLAASVDYPASLKLGQRPDAENVLAVDPKIRGLVNSLGWIDDSTVRDAEGIHGVNCTDCRL
jgi:hypothetical protein